MSDAEQAKSSDPATLEPSSTLTPTDPTGIRQAGVELGEFRLLRRLGRGGMAEVWLAEQITLKRNVALKLLRPELMEDESYVARFQTEAKAAAGLNHPNIVQVYTVGCERGQHFIAQEYVDGQTLKSLLQRKGPLDLPVALMIMRQVAAALATAGERGIVHRDIKPENIMITRKGEAKVADFGLAQLQGGDQLKLTQEGITMGTPLYMSPEQVSGRPLDQRSDVYSFGITCFHMLAGRPPFEGENAVTVAVKHLHEAPPSLGEIRADLPPAVCQVVRKMIAKNPESRYQDAQSIVQDVRKLAKSLRTGEPVEDLVAPEETVRSRFPMRHAAIILPALALLVFVASAALGWGLRPGLPPRDSSRAVAQVARLETARDQYIDAMFKVDDEEAYWAVIRLWPQPANFMWTQQAYEQLAFLYMKDSKRWPEAEKILKKLTDLEPGNPRQRAKARVGEAYLHAMRQDLEMARGILLAEQDHFAEYLSGSWKQLEDDVRQLVQQHDQRNSNSPQADSADA